MRASRLFTSTGLRLSALQTILLILLFVVIGVLARLTIMFAYRQQVQARMEHQVAAIVRVERDKGAIGAAGFVAGLVNRPGGLQYRLEDVGGRRLAGDLPSTGAKIGWTYLDWDDTPIPGHPFKDLLVLVQKLPDGQVLTVGQDLSAESQLKHKLKNIMLWCGCAGGIIGLGLSYLGRGAMRRVDSLAAAARSVSAGDMSVRAPVRAALVRDDVDDLAATFNIMLDEIATLVSRVRWVSTDIAHDLRTPLTHVRQKLETIQRATGADADVKAVAQEIDQDVDGLLRRFDAMLRLAEIENDAALKGREPVDLAELTGRIADAYRPDLEESGRRLEVVLQPAAARGDADLIGHAIANLIENALRHTPIGALIRVAVSQAEEVAVVSVSDDGPGIPTDQREVVLQRFHRLEASRTTPGFGLGLQIVTAIAKRHGAMLTLSDAGPGLAAVLTFPAEFESA